MKAPNKQTIKKIPPPGYEPWSPGTESQWATNELRQPPLCYVKYLEHDSLRSSARLGHDAQVALLPNVSFDVLK